MKAYSGEKIIAAIIFNVSTEWKWLAAVALLPGKEAPISGQTGV